MIQIYAYSQPFFVLAMCIVLNSCVSLNIMTGGGTVSYIFLWGRGIAATFCEALIINDNPLTGSFTEWCRELNST